MNSDSNPSRPQAKQRRASGGGLRAVAATLPKIAGPLFGRQGLGAAGLAKDWRHIVGAGIADRCQPCRLSFPRNGQRHEGTLTLLVEPSFATEVQHLEPLFIERINSFFGYRAVARLRLQQGPVARPVQETAAPPRPLTVAEETELNLQLAGVDDPELRAALERLARSFQGRRGR